VSSPPILDRLDPPPPRPELPPPLSPAGAAPSHGQRKLSAALRRPRTFWVSIVNLVGLACSLVGVVLLFWFALPIDPPGATEYFWGGPPGSEWWYARQRYDRYSHIGLALVVVGTLLEAAAPFCTAIGSWRRRL
jgi:hypothetical protein